MERIRSVKGLENALTAYYKEVKGQSMGEGAHGIAHARNTGRGARPVGILLGASSEAVKLATVSGYLHDFKRTDSENPVHKDEEASAEIAHDFLVRLDQAGGLKTTPDQRHAVVYAITNHGEYPDYWANPHTRNDPITNLADQVRVLNFAPDKGDANGAQVIARRSMHVAGGRLLGPKADLPAFGFNPHSPEDQIAAVVAEGAIRLSIINPRGIYPEALSPFVDPLYDVQLPFVDGLCKAANLSVDEIAKLILERKNSDGVNMLDQRKLSAPRNVVDLTKLFKEVGGLNDDAIQDASPELVTSSVRTLQYFQPRWNQDFDATVTDWKPESQFEMSWKADMLDYNSGKWFNKIARQARASQR